MDLIEQSGLGELSQALSSPIMKLFLELTPLRYIVPFAEMGADHMDRRRVKMLFETLDLRLQDLETNMITREYLEQEEFIYLVRRAVRISLECAVDDKIRLIATALANTVIGAFAGLDEAEDTLRTIDALQLSDVSVLAHMIDFEKTAEKGEYYTSLRWPNEAERPRVERSLARLTTLGLARELTGAYGGDMYYSTVYGKRFLAMFQLKMNLRKRPSLP